MPIPNAARVKQAEIHTSHTKGPAMQRLIVEKDSGICTVRFHNPPHGRATRALYCRHQRQCHGRMENMVGGGDIRSTC